VTDGQVGLADIISMHAMVTNQILLFNFETVAKNWLQYIRLITVLSSLPHPCPAPHHLHCECKWREVKRSGGKLARAWKWGYTAQFEGFRLNKLWTINTNDTSARFSLTFLEGES